MFDKTMVAVALQVKRGMASNYKQRTDRQTDREPLGGHLSSCSGCAWPAKRSRHLIASFCTEALCGPAASRRRGRIGEEEEGPRMTPTHESWTPHVTNKGVLLKQQCLGLDWLHQRCVCVCVWERVEGVCFRPGPGLHEDISAVSP